MDLYQKVIKLGVIVFILTSFWAVPALASTNVSGSILVDTTWTTAESPYIVSNLNINAGVTLTIESGVVVKFQDENSYIDVSGTLNANGTENEKIYFTSFLDDTVGGDTNSDGSNTVPSARNWKNIKFNSGSVGTLSYATIRYAGGNPFTGIYNNGGDLTISNSLVTENGDKGIMNWAGNLNIFSSEIGDHLYGVQIFSGTINIDGNDIHDHTSYGIVTQNNSGSLILTNNTFKDNSVSVSVLVGNDFTHSGNTATGNGINGIGVGGAITQDLTWNKDSMPYVVSTLLVNSGVTFNIDPGVIVKFEEGRYIDIAGTLNANGTGIEKIYFTSIKDDTIGGDTNGDGSNTAPAPGDWRNLKWNGGTGNLSNSVLRYGGYATFLGGISIYNNGGNLSISDSIVSESLGQGLFQSGGETTITSSVFSNQDYGIHRSGGVLDISGSSINNNSIQGILNNGGGTINAVNNYWGDPTGPYNEITNPSGLGNGVSGNVNFIPFLTSDPFGPTPPPTTCTTDCFSNVLFLPGVMGSRLYNSTDQELWVSKSDSRHAELALDNQGKSIDSTIRTKGDEAGIVEEIPINFLPDPNIYKSFIDDLKKWKNDDKIIADYKLIPYDWRLSLNDIITNGATDINGNISYNISQNFSESFILKKLEELQLSSRTGKVTIIAHSNGGLVAKALIQKLNDTNNPLYDKIDKVILVAVPQVGTPDAVAMLLHGSEIGPGGIIMDNDRSRHLSENMPAIYNLLPSNGYFTTVDPAFAVDKIASFENIPFFNPQTSQYGVFISNATELKNYILGTDGRTKPSFSETLKPNIGNSALYTQAQSVHQILDSWQPSPSTKVIQVAGWGEETLAGLDYTTKKGATETISYTPRMVVDGDGTVVVPSALWMSDSSSNVERWWVDLLTFNSPVLNINRKHKNILEIANLLGFIKSEIKNVSGFTDPENIIVNNSSILISNKTRLRYILHSPLTLGITDAQGRYTGMDPVTKEIREEIPGVNYRQIGEVQFISVPTGVDYTLQLKGYQQGDFTLDIEKQQGNTVTDTTSFQGIPSSTTTVATVDIPANFEVATSSLKIDQNGDGVVDKTLPATPNGTTVYDTTPPELQVTFNINTKDVVFSARDLIDPNPSIIITTTSITLADHSGNTTIIPFTKFREFPTRLRLSYNKITRNGVTSTLPNTNIVYDWKDKKGVLTDLDTKVIIK
ncbi:MAG TPA: right-handed parallel beta-helix repeat-containing protein, partial [Candidatus Paceibacterota bacterium]